MRAAVRTWCVAGMLAMATAFAAAQPVPAGVKALGVFSLLGETLEVSTTAEPTASRLDRTTRQSLTVRGLGLDRLVAGEVRQHAATALPTVHLRMFGPSAPLTPQDQRAVADRATRGALPGWMIDTIQQQRLTHVLLATRDQAPAAAETATAEKVGRVDLEGIGFHIDMLYGVRDADNQVRIHGALAPHVIVRLTLFDVEAAQVIRTASVNEQWLVAPRADKVADGPWGLLTQEEKLKAVHQALGSGLRKALPGLLSAL
jgi:hypothetical protein